MTGLPKGFRVMKGVLLDTDTFAHVKYPAYVSGKIDGYRCINNVFGEPRTSSLARFTNEYVYNKICGLNTEYAQFLDGEICVGEPNDPDIYKKTSGPVRRFDGEPPFTFWVFDSVRIGGGFASRYAEAKRNVEALGVDFVCIVPQVCVENESQLREALRDFASQGFEGSIIRWIYAPYKYGRATANEGYLFKDKEFVDFEARIDSVEEQMHNLNDATVNNSGLLKRSTNAENLIGAGVAGKVICTGLNGKYEGKKFAVSLSTMKHDEKRSLWLNRNNIRGVIITYTCLKYDAGYDLPRGAKYKCFRPDWDM